AACRAPLAPLATACRWHCLRCCWRPAMRTAAPFSRCVLLAGECSMLKLTGNGTAQTCDGITRRDFLQVGALGAVGLSLPQYLAAKEAGAVNDDSDRACIMIFNLGAPSQLDTFDMKPE